MTASCVASRFIGRDTFWKDSAAWTMGKFVTKSASWLKQRMVPTAAAVATLAVITEPLRPKETPPPFAKVTAVRLFDVVPAERLRFATALAVTIELPIMPNVTPFEFEKATVPEVAICVPALMAPIPAETAATGTLTRRRPLVSTTSQPLSSL